MNYDPPFNSKYTDSHRDKELGADSKDKFLNTDKDKRYLGTEWTLRTNGIYGKTNVDYVVIENLLDILYGTSCLEQKYNDYLTVRNAQKDYSQHYF
ncbi:hypothetical protein V1503_23670 [Bacillus sp. SCS-151]|uniref:hypothetical protein n=1 Tax=Nanhaiella sioensis TaxID=3115293 RepID=UPI00397994CE